MTPEQQDALLDHYGALYRAANDVLVEIIELKATESWPDGLIDEDVLEALEHEVPRLHGPLRHHDDLERPAAA